MRRRGWLPLLACVLLLAYLPLLGQGFQSEDYLLLRWLGEHPPWQEEAGGFAKPWLGITAVGFYRPVATWIFAGERALFGATVLGYDLVHWAVHLLNSLLVFAIARRFGGGGLCAGSAALAFGLFPLAPDAVLFLASFATLFGTLFLLFALWLYSRGDGELSVASTAGVVAASAAALASYEATVILPAWLALRLIWRWPSRPSPRRVATLAACVVLVLVYAALRVRLFGSFLGGYRETASILSWVEVRSLAGRGLACLARLGWPLSFAPPQVLRDGAIVLAWMGAVWGALRRPEQSGASPTASRGVVLALIATLAALAPFAFQPLVPGIGRYAYLAAVAPALGFGALAGRAWTPARGGHPRALARLALVSWSIVWLVALAQVVAAHRDGRRLARTSASALEQAVARRPGPCYVAGAPWFVSRRGVPYASVLRYGLADSLGPPFGAEKRQIYPLPPSYAAPDLQRVLGTPACVEEWDEARSTWVSAPRTAAPAIERLTALLEWNETTARGRVRFDSRPLGGHRLVVLTRGNATVVEETASGVDVPVDFLQTMARLYPGEPIVWWLERRDGQGTLLAASEARSLLAVAGSPGAVIPLVIRQ